MRWDSYHDEKNWDPWKSRSCHPPGAFRLSSHITPARQVRILAATEGQRTRGRELESGADIIIVLEKSKDRRGNNRSQSEAVPFGRPRETGAG
jgi:hypothetical protein